MSGGVAFGWGPCFCCHRPFAFNPMRVPSVVVDGDRRQVCRDCVELVNPIRVANGLEPIVPLPDAYEACAEEELG